MDGVWDERIRTADYTYEVWSAVVYGKCNIIHLADGSMQGMPDITLLAHPVGILKLARARRYSFDASDMQVQLGLSRQARITRYSSGIL